MAISRSTKISLLLVIDFVFFLVEIIVGYAVGSLALVADSFHMLNDIMSLIVALYAIKLTAQNHTDTRYSYGWHRAEILAALVNGVFLLALCFSIFMEAIERFFSTPEISNPKLVVIVGSLGLASNFLGLFLFHEHSHSHGDDHGHAHNHKKVDQPDEAGDIEHSSGTATPVDADGIGRRRSNSLYGHPVATRAYFVQAAQDLQLARSASPYLDEPGARPSSSYKAAGIHNVLDEENGHSEVTNQTEATPLLRGHNLEAHVAHATEDTAAPPTKPKRRAHDHGSMNMRALVLHVLGDALGNVGVIATGLVIWLSDWSWKFYFDPIVSLVITVIIFSSALPLVKSASFILLQGVPAGISLEEVDQAIRAVDGVESVHELHIWQLSESKIVASVHVLASKQSDFMRVTADIRRTLHDHGIHSSTIQPEYHVLPPSGNNSNHCLLPCPPGMECDPAQSACCPPPPTTV